ncbi:MAG: hypothetical protein AMXMBFR82_30740 [Candidatus Hydrogenedentota bacterium]
MLTISDPDRYARYAGQPKGALREFILWALLFGSVGGIAWAIRGTTGWGGIDGTIVPGMAYGLLWYWVCRCKGVDARGVALWLGLGIAIGGEWGYGQYTGWIRGTFETVDGLVPLNPAVGHLWFFLCGIAWGAPGGVALGWVLSGKHSLHTWLVRLVVPLGAALLGRMLIQVRPGWFFPNFSSDLYTPVPGTTLPETYFFQNQPFMTGAWLVCVVLIAVSWYLSKNNHPYRDIGRGLSILSVVYSISLVLCMGWWLARPEDGLGLFSGELDKHLGRTVYTNAQNAIVVAWAVGAMVVAAAQRDKWTLAMNTIVGFGFGFGMMISALWCLGYIHWRDYIDWWKLWEVHAGFNLGVLYALALWWALHQVGKEQRRQHATSPEPIPAALWTGLDGWWRPLASAAGVLLIWAYLFFEDDLVASLLLGPLYVAAVCWVTLEANRNREPDAVYDRQQSLSLTFAAFYLLFFLFHGVTTRFGVVLELYDADAVGQYEWPVQRLLLFLPAAIPIVAVTLYKTWQIAHCGKSPLQTPLDWTSLRIGTLIALTGFVGAASIWPSEIAVVYAAALVVAVYAYLQLVFTYNTTDDTLTQENLS